jgi:hypothetical protein
MPPLPASHGIGYIDLVEINLYRSRRRGGGRRPRDDH